MLEHGALLSEKPIFGDTFAFEQESAGWLRGIK